MTDPYSNLFHQIVLHLPILTTLCAAFFCAQLFARYRAKGGGLHLLWWGIGMATYALGTLTEAVTTLFGWHPFVFRLWYVAGAFLGGYPLAQGSIYLLMNRRFAHASAIVVTSFLAVASTLVFLTPLDTALAEPHRLSGAAIEWTWIRALSPFVNLYSVAFLVGGAVVSALRFRKAAALRHRYVGNILIAIGAVLPGIGGAMTRAGYVEVLYVTELVGLLLVYAGYRFNIAERAAPLAASSTWAPRTAAVALLGGTLALLAAAPLPAQEEGAKPEAETAAEEASPEAEAEALPSFFEKTTVTATGHEADVLETATPVTVVDRQEIERQTPDNASDLLRAEPGVDVNGVGPNQSRPIIRGQRGLRVLFLADGLRMNNPRRQSDFGEIPGLIDIDAVETMEVVRGPASVLYGSDAIGGVLNLITKAPAGEGLHGGVALRYGSAAESFGVHGALSGRYDRAAFQLDASVREADDYEAPDGEFGDIRLADSVPVLDSGLDDDSLTGTLLWDATESQELSFKLTRYRADQAGFGLVEPELLGDPIGPGDARVRILYPFQDFDRYTIGWQGTDLGRAGDVIEARLYYQDNERELANDIDINIGPLGPGFPDSSVLADTLNFTDLETWGARLEARKGLGNDRHLISYGAEGYRDDSFNTDTSTTTTILRFPFPPFELPIVTTDDVANAPNAEHTSWGAFAQAEIAATDRLLVTAGARYQTVETRAEATPGLDIAGLDFDDDRTVGSISAIFQATPELRVYGSYGTAFRAPNIIERLFNGITPEGIGFQILNPALESETSENIDLGVKYRRDNAVFELTLFRNDIDDGIVQHFLTLEEQQALPEEVQQQIPPGLAFVVQQRNADRLRYEGVEVSAGYRAPHDLAFGGNYTYLDAERVGSANPPTGDTYSDKVNVFARWEPLDRPFWAEARVRHNGDDELALQPGEPAPVVGTTLPSFTVVALAGGWTFLERDRARHELFARLENLTDELYSESSNATFFRPQPERDLRVGYRLRL